MTYFENNLIFHKNGKKNAMYILYSSWWKFFVLLYINSPVFEKQIKSAKNKMLHFPTAQELLQRCTAAFQDHVLL